MDVSLREAAAEAALQSVEQLEEILFYTFTDKLIAQRALTTSGVWEDFERIGYEELEFLGDRVLNLCAAIDSLVEERYQSIGTVRRHYDRYTNNVWLCQVGVKLDLARLILDGQTGLPTFKHDPLAYSKRVADVLEAVLAAVYVDSALDIQRVLAIYYRWRELVPN